MRQTPRQKRIAAAKLRARQKAEGKKLTGRQDPALAMAYAYEEALGDYNHRPGLKFIKNRRLDPEKVTSRYFLQAARLADVVEADYHEFVRAQFYWMHLWFGRECRTHELRGKNGKMPAVDRWRSYRDLIDAGEISAVPASSSVTYKVDQITEDELNRINKDRVAKLKQLWEMDEDQVLISFAPEGVFDRQWLACNSRYQELRQEGKIE